MNPKSKTIAVNFFAGPGAGKTTCTWAVASELKKRGINTEYVSEYAKELVWDENWPALKDQVEITRIQTARMKRLEGKVDVIVTDSPIILGSIYGKNNSPEFTERMFKDFNSFINFNLFIRRGKDYQQAGRVENFQEAKQKDLEIEALLKNNNIFYGVYTHNTLKTLTDNIITTLSRVNPAAVPKNVMD